MPPLKEYIDEIKDIWDTHWLTNMGEKHQRLQEQLREYLGVHHIELLTNGHMALELTMQAMKLHGEVITTPFTFASTTHAIVRNHLKPVFCDINPVDYTIDVSRIESLITEKTCAIVPVHVYGNVCNVKEIERVARKYRLKVIYDAAHAFGVKYKGCGIGNFGDASCFSFHATKVFNTIEGGAVCVQDEAIEQELYRLKNFGIRGPEIVDGIGANAKMNEFCAAMGLCNLKYVGREIAKRKKIVLRYMENLKKVEGLQLPEIQEGVESNYAYFPIVVNEDIFGMSRNEIYSTLARNEIYARKYFYPLTNTFECYRGMYNADSTPTALQISNRIMTLPLYSDLTLDNVDRICDIMSGCKERK